MFTTATSPSGVTHGVVGRGTYCGKPIPANSTTNTSLRITCQRCRTTRHYEMIVLGHDWRP